MISRAQARSFKAAAATARCTIWFGNHLLNTSTLIEAEVEALGETPRMAAMLLSGEVTISVPNSRGPVLFCIICTGVSAVTNEYLNGVSSYFSCVYTETISPNVIPVDFFRRIATRRNR